MTYAISDIHGCYDEYIKLLDKIGFSKMTANMKFTKKTVTLQ